MLKHSITRIPNRDLSRESNPSSSVITYQLSESELLNRRYSLVHKSGLDRETCIRRVANGEKLSQIERSLKMKSDDIYYWAKKWGIIGINQSNALSFLNQNDNNQNL